jgi:signal transduction histidine kinase
MQKYLGDILLEQGYINSADLDRALTCQTSRILGTSPSSGWVTTFLLDIARKKYNQRGEYYLGKILTELNLLPETKVAEALEIQRRSPLEKPRGKLEALNQVTRRINSSYNLIDLLNQILVLAAEITDAESASLIIYDHAKDALVILMPTGPRAEELRDLEIPKDQGFVGWVYRTGHSLLSNDAPSDPRFYPGIDATVGYRSRQIICTPLLIKGKKLGALEVINKRSAAGAAATGFSKADLFLLEMFSSQAAIAIENTRLTLALSRAETECSSQKARIAEEERSRGGMLVSQSLLHEMRRSLVPLQGYAGRMADVLPDARLDKYGSFIDRELGRLIGTAEEAVRFFRGEFVARMQPVKAAALLDELESRTWVDCRLSGIAFHAATPGDLVLKADRELLLRALEILFRNSREAMPEGGEFRVRADQSGAFATLEVSDSGPGLAEGTEERIFEPFYSEGKRDAAGLGLAIARRIVEAHGGTIQASSRSAGGALFTIALPSS